MLLTPNVSYGGATRLLTPTNHSLQI